MSAKIAVVRESSIAHEMGVEAGDTLVSICGHTIHDILDYQFYSQEDQLQLEISKQNGEIWQLEIDKDFDEDLGLEFADLLFESMKTCQNQCIFCFVDQLPPNMRPSLYIKDDDYRHSFIYGNFVTLTNMRTSDWAKIEEMHLSPLYVSVHCVQEGLRREMLKHRRAGDLLGNLQRLQAAGIEVHTQIVLCPGWNDGQILVDTIDQLGRMFPCVASVGVVPVGLTKYRQGLPELNPVSAELATKTIAVVDKMQSTFRKQLGLGFVYLADEFYLTAGLPIPGSNYDDDYCQIENGIGLIRWFWEDFRELEGRLPQRLEARSAYIVTGDSGEKALRPLVDRLNQIEGLSVSILPVPNRFFGGEITVTGLLTGQDIMAVLGPDYQGQRVILPAVIFKEGQDVLLDGICLSEIRASSGADILIAETDPQSLWEAIIKV
ncbi:MAG: DUF512 domain-containing protein [Syntrophomonadaceae bacterium]|nr:DUF512 domain-containing protein [Syntrophomonadaceae bacterium]